MVMEVHVPDMHRFESGCAADELVGELGFVVVVVLGGLVDGVAGVAGLVWVWYSLGVWG
jgi:hypothetical protein